MVTSDRNWWQKCSSTLGLLTYLAARSTCTAGSISRSSIRIETSGGNGQCISKKSPFPNVPTQLVDRFEPQGSNRRAEDTTGNGRSCDICGGLHGTGILPDAPVPSFPKGEFSGDPPGEGACTDWGKYLSDNSLSGSYECVYFTYFLAAQCCDLSNMTASYVSEAQLKSELLGEDSNYEATAVPVPAGQQSLNVTAVLTCYHISSIDTVEGTAEMFFQIDLSWYDERLAWDPADHDGCTNIDLRASLNSEWTEIYVPDFDLLNRVDGVANLPDGIAQITPDGRVRWKRLGRLKAICAFTGLEPIPFDSLGCYLKFGSLYDNKVFYQFGKGDPDTPGLIYSNFPSNYQEFSLLQDRSQTYVDTREFRALTYQFFFDRAANYYIIKIVVPTIMFTYLSFGSFLLDQRVGERLSYGVSILLVLVANSIITADMLPISNSALWIDNFALVSYYWVMLAVIESVFVAYLFYLDSEEEKEEARKAEEERREEEIRKSEKEGKARAEESLKNGLESENINNRNDTDDASGGESAHIALDAETASYTEVSEKSNDHSIAGNNKNHHSQTESFSSGRDHEEESLRSRIKFFRKVVTQKEKPTERRKLQIIKNLDRFCLAVLPLTYTIYWVTMLAIRNTWG